MQLRAFRNLRHRAAGNAGFTMTEAIIAVGILGVITYTGLDMWKTISGIKTKLNIESDRIDVGLALRDRIDCSKTLAALSPATVCDSASAASPVPAVLKDSTDQTIVASTNYASNAVTSAYQAKATCYKDGDYFIFNANILVPSQTNQDVKVFKNIGYTCWDAPPPPPSEPPPPSGSCYALGDSGPDPSCVAPCPYAYNSCYYNGSLSASFRLYGTGADCSALPCPGTPTKERCTVAGCSY
jgi:hypothetical protein